MDDLYILLKRMNICKILHSKDPEFDRIVDGDSNLIDGSISIDQNQVCEDQMFREAMIWKFGYKHNIHTVNEEYITKEFKRTHHERWRKHKSIVFGKMKWNREKAFWEGSLPEDECDRRCREEEIKMQQKNSQNERKV